MLRHEQHTVRMALATFTLHSAQRQKTARARGVEHEENYEPRPPDPPLPPQGAATVGYVAAPVPSLFLPVLSNRAAEVVDSSSLQILTARCPAAEGGGGAEEGGGGG